MLWTPAILPPPPSSVPSGSPLAQSVLSLIRQEGESGGSGSRSHHDRLRDRPNVNTGVGLETRRDVSDATDGLFDLQTSAGVNPMANVGLHSRNYGNPWSFRNSNALPSSSNVPPLLERSPFGVPPWSSTDVENLQREQYLRSFYSQTQPSQNVRESAGKANITQTYVSPFERRFEIKENDKPINRLYNLSPDMEFDDMEVYSCPPDEPEKENIKIINRNQGPAVNFPVAPANSLNFKEIKPRPLQKSGLQIKNPIPYPKLVDDINRLSALRKIRPSDQTFILNDTNSVPKFKKNLAKFKQTSCRKPNQAKSFVQVKKGDKDILQMESKTYNQKITFGEPKSDLGHQKSPVNVRTKEGNFELEDIFDEPFDNLMVGTGQEDKNSKSIGVNATQEIERNSKKIKCSRNPSKSADLSTSEELLVGNQEKNFQRVIGLPKQQEVPNIINISANDSNSNQQSELSENLFVKTQESQIVNSLGCLDNRVDDVCEKEQSLNTTSDLLASKQQSELSQNLFVKTQESIALKHDCPQNRIGPNDFDQNNHSEELSFPPYQKPLESSPDFDVDDLFSLKDETLKESLAAFKGNSENTKSLNSVPAEGKTSSINNSKSDSLNITEINRPTKKDDEKQTMNTNIERNNCDNNPPVTSIYFQGSEQKSNSTTDFQNVSFKNGKFRESMKGMGNSERSRQIKDVKTSIAAGTSRSANGGITDRKRILEVETELGGKPFKKKPSLKQSTLFDCRKFQTEKINTDFHDSESKLSAPVELPDQVENFKKPQLPVKKAKTKTTPKANVVNKTDKSPTILDKPSCSKSNEKEFLHSNTPLKDIRGKCDPSKLVQKSLFKNEPVVKSVGSTAKSKTKKSNFVPPIAATHLTSKEVPLKNYTITVIDEVSAAEVLTRLASDELTKVVTTVAFKEGYTLLNKPEQQARNSRCFPSGVMFLLSWGSGRAGYHWLPLVAESSPAIAPSVAALVDAIMSRSERNVCFEAQAVYMLLMDTLKVKDISGWNALDPLIAAWLLDPDDPPKDFYETSGRLQVAREALAVHPQADTKTQACQLLQVLDVAMNLLQSRLVAASLWTVFTEMETKLIPLLAVMESSSILVDVDRLHRTAEAMDRRLRKLMGEAHTFADCWFQLNSPQQLREVLFDKLKLDDKFGLKIKKTEHGVKSTSETVLEQMRGLHPLPGIILEYRRLQKLKSTYVDGLLQHVKSDGTVSTSWEQVSAATGRVTSKNPNLQAFPKVAVQVSDDGEPLRLREMFRARAGHTFLAADFQQIEFRVFAHFTRDAALLQAFREGGDIFQRLAERWLGGRGEEEREKTKRIVYSVMYGAGANKLSEYLRVEPSEAYRIIDNFVSIFPSLRSLPRTVIAQCRVQGCVTTLSGRRRLFPHIRSSNGGLRSHAERQAINFLIQGSAADICKAAMLDCQTEIRARGLRAKLLLMIHDELVWEVDDRDLHQTAVTVREAMEHRWNERLTLLVPIPVCVSSGPTLADMRRLDERNNNSGGTTTATPLDS